MNYIGALPVYLLALLAIPLYAAEKPDDSAIESELTRLLGRAPDRIGSVPLPGIREVVYDSKIYYVSSDGRYLLHGELVDLQTRESLTEKRLSLLRIDMLNDVSKEEMIIYKATDEEKHVISVFTDIDCVFCRKLHAGMPQMNKLGITVRYLAYPRSGLNTPSYDKAVSVWCAKDRQLAMDDAKNNDKVTPLKCADNPVSKQFLLGQKMGVSGTPAIFLESGRLMPGYLPADKLLAMLEGRELAPQKR